MKDTHETNLSAVETANKSEETKAPEVMQEKKVAEVETSEASTPDVSTEETATKPAPQAEETESNAALGKLTKAEILEKLTALTDAPAEASRNEV